MASHSKIKRMAEHGRSVIRVGNTGSLPRTMLAERLKALRKAAGLNQTRVGEAMGRSFMTISRWEDPEKEPGTNIPEPPQLFYLLTTVFKVDEAERAELMALAEEARQPPGETVSIATTDFDWLERRSTRVAAYADFSVPGQLQTADYARAVLRAWDPTAPSETIEYALAARLARQRRVDDGSLSLEVVVSESAIWHVVGGPSTMREQLTHLAERARLDNVDLRVVPFEAGAHPGFAGEFSILSRGEGRGVVWVTTRGEPLLFEDPEPFEGHLKRIRAMSLPPRKSIAKIGAAMRRIT